MTESAFQSSSIDHLEQHLAPRRAAEARQYKGRNPDHSFILSHFAWMLRPMLRAGLAASGLYGRGMRNALAVRVVHHRLSFANLPEAISGMRLLHLSDLHIDGLEGLAEVVAREVAAIPVDLCILTGDYRFHVEGPCDRVYAGMRTLLKAVRSRRGAIGILGNHDSADMALELEAMGVRMLINDSIEVLPGFWVTGADEADRGEEFRRELGRVPAGGFRLTLAHTPDRYAEAAAAGTSLYLCGHTHAGQVCLPGGQMTFRNAHCPREYTRGLWKHGGMVGFTTAGAGCCMLPVRYNCPPEIAVLELHRA